MTISYSNEQLEGFRTKLHRGLISMSWLQTTLEMLIIHGRNANDEIARLREENQEIQERLAETNEELIYWSNR